MARVAMKLSISRKLKLPIAREIMDSLLFTFDLY